MQAFQHLSMQLKAGISVLGVIDDKKKSPVARKRDLVFYRAVRLRGKMNL